MKLEAQALIPIQYQSTRNKKNIKAPTLNRMFATHLRHYLQS